MRCKGTNDGEGENGIVKRGKEKGEERGEKKTKKQRRKRNDEAKVNFDFGKGKIVFHFMVSSTGREGKAEEGRGRTEEEGGQPQIQGHSGTHTPHTTHNTHNAHR